MIAVAAGGLVVLVALACLIGAVEARSHREAWRRIAADRHDLHRREAELVAAAERGYCPSCRRALGA